MKIIKLMVNGEYAQFGFEGKVLYYKAGLLQTPKRLGEFKDIRKVGLQKNISHRGQTQVMNSFLRGMANGITLEGIRKIKTMTDEEFYNEILQDWKEVSDEGGFVFLGEAKEWD